MARASNLNKIFRTITGHDLPKPEDVKVKKPSGRVIIDMPSDLKTTTAPPDFIISDPPPQERTHDRDIVDENISVATDINQSMHDHQLHRIQQLAESISQLNKKLSVARNGNNRSETTRLITESTRLKDQVTQLLLEYDARTHQRNLHRMYIQQQIDEIRANPHYYASTQGISIDDIPEVISQLHRDMIRNERLSEEDMIFEVSRDPSTLAVIKLSNQVTPKVYDAAFRKDPMVFRELPDSMKRSRNRQLSLVRRKPLWIYWITNPSEEIQIAAVQVDPSAIGFVEEHERSQHASNLAYQLSNGHYGTKS